MLFFLMQYLSHLTWQWLYLQKNLRNLTPLHDLSNSLRKDSFQMVSTICFLCSLVLGVHSLCRQSFLPEGNHHIRWSNSTWCFACLYLPPCHFSSDFLSIILVKYCTELILLIYQGTNLFHYVTVWCNFQNDLLFIYRAFNSA